MPFDVAATVIANTRLSHDYNVLTLAAPEIARTTIAGQFVMVKPSTGGSDPLLRRPFSVFEIIPGRNGEPDAISILIKRIGVTTRLLYDARVGDLIVCLGPLGQPFRSIAPPEEGWMVAGGVGLAPFWTLARDLAGRGVPASLFYGARRGDELFYLEYFQSLGVRLILTTEDGSVGERGRVIAPLDRALAARPAAQPVTIFACGPEGMLAAAAQTAAAHGRTCEVSVERIMGCGMGGCYSCVVPMKTAGGGSHHVRSCLSGPVLDAAQIDWSEGT
jgi:dihydroorotate dehydrogenase electron transfer subunit